LRPQSDILFSIAIPAYNAADTIDEAIESIISQTYANWELVVVDDGSVDDTFERAMRYAAEEPRITVYRQSNIGCGRARAVAIERSSGDFIVHFDADDIMLPRCLEAYAAFISANPDYSVYSCNGERFDDGSQSELIFSGSEADKVREFELEEMVQQNCISGLAAVFSRAKYVRAGGIRPTAHTEDYDLWLRMAATGEPVVYIPQVLARYRQRSGQMTSDLGRIFEGTAEAIVHLADSGVLSDATMRLARDCGERYARLGALHRAVARRSELEERLLRGDFRDARSEFLATRLAYSSAAKYWLGLVVMLVSPTIYAFEIRRLAGRSASSEI